MAKSEKRSVADLAELEREYRALTPVAGSLCVELASQLNRLLDNEGITLGFPIQYRVKQWDSLSEKFQRVSLQVRSIKDVQDLVGLRLILLYRRDVEKVCHLISDNFTVVRQYDTQERLKEDQFGYSSIHFVVELPETWLAVPTLAPLGGLRAEIQVRTLAQHIWAEASHSLQYKRETNVPPLILRTIYRVSALLETVDLEFERVLEQRESYRAEADISGTEDKLNVDLLEKTLDSMLPQENKKDDEDYSDLLKDLTQFGVETQQQLRNLIQQYLAQALKADRDIVNRKSKALSAGKVISGTTPERIQKGVFYTHVGLIREILSDVFGTKWSEYQREKLTRRSQTKSA